MAELLKTLEPEIESITLIPSEDGRFEVTVNEQLVFSKAKLHRHADPGEVLKLVRKLLKEGSKT
jgi:selenoprotein W-related protein